ncbi:MAG TPA: alpha/beta hydrolase [Xanthomonadaceae bacterium]|jgi:pimeloyl-ACP methyl ester carboxylesterase|nr:alpha/beta hydrolase [Xanthomonadaceae bacterium]
MSLKRIFLGLIVASALAYVSLGVLLYAMQDAVLYHPQPLSFEPDATAITIPAPSGVLHGWVVDPGQPDAVIYYGGNGEAVERDADFFRATLPDRSVYLVPYRGYGPNPGKPSEAAIEADELAVHDFVHARHAHVSLIGRSLGTGIATFVAAHRPVERLVLVTPYDSILEIARARYGIFPVSLLMKDRYESWRNADAIEEPALVLLGADDEVIPRANSDALIAHLHPKPIVVVIPHAGHNDLSDSPLYAQAIADFMRPPAATPTATRALRH